MDKVAIIYKSKYGSSKKYALLLSKKLNTKVFETDKTTVCDLLDFDTIIYLGGVYLGKISGFSFIKKNYKEIEDKKIIACAVCATTKFEEARLRLINHNLDKKLKDKIPLFILRGSLYYEKMNFIDKFLMSALIMSEKLKGPKKWDEDSKHLIETYGKNTDFTNEDYLLPILDEIKA